MSKHIFVILFALTATCHAGIISPVSYENHNIEAVSSTQQNLLRGYDKTISQYSNSIESPYANVHKQDTRITNNHYSSPNTNVAVKSHLYTHVTPIEEKSEESPQEKHEQTSYQVYTQHATAVNEPTTKLSNTVAYTAPLTKVYQPNEPKVTRYLAPSVRAKLAHAQQAQSQLPDYVQHQQQATGETVYHGFSKDHQSTAHTLQHVAQPTTHIVHHEAPATKNVQNETPGTYTVHHEAPVTYTPQQETPATYTVHHETPVAQHAIPTARFVYQQAPTTHLVQNETPATYSIHHSVPTTHFIQQQAPSTHFVQEHAPTTHFLQHQAPAAHSVQQATSTAHHTVNLNTPATHFVKHDVPATYSFQQYAAPAAKIVQHSAPATKIVQHSAPTAHLVHHYETPVTYSHNPAASTTTYSHSNPVQGGYGTSQSAHYSPSEKVSYMRFEGFGTHYGF